MKTGKSCHIPQASFPPTINILQHCDVTINKPVLIHYHLLELTSQVSLAFLNVLYLFQGPTQDTTLHVDVMKLSVSAVYDSSLVSLFLIKL